MALTIALLLHLWMFVHALMATQMVKADEEAETEKLSAESSATRALRASHVVLDGGAKAQWYRREIHDVIDDVKKEPKKKDAENDHARRQNIPPEGKNRPFVSLFGVRFKRHKLEQQLSTLHRERRQNIPPEQENKALVSLFGVRFRRQKTPQESSTVDLHRRQNIPPDPRDRPLLGVRKGSQEDPTVTRRRRQNIPPKPEGRPFVRNSRFGVRFQRQKPWQQPESWSRNKKRDGELSTNGKRGMNEACVMHYNEQKQTWCCTICSYCGEPVVRRC